VVSVYTKNPPIETPICLPAGFTAIPISKRKSASTFTAKGNFRRHKRLKRNLRSVAKQIGAKSTAFTEQNAPKIKKMPLKLYQIQNFSEIGIAAGFTYAPS
jgi:hypothetical protein